MDADVIIVGAGPAGSIAALQLARAGYRVLVLEKAGFPREKVCGGCLSGDGVSILNRLVGPRSWPEAPVREITFHIGSYQLRTASRGRTSIVLRPKFDDFLIHQAIQAGAEVRFNCHARLIPDSNPWQVTVADYRLKARAILVASGLGGIPSCFTGQRLESQQRMIGQQWIQPGGKFLPPVGHVEMHWLRGGYVGIATPAENCTIVAIATELDRGDRRSAWEKVRDSNPNSVLWDILPDDAPQRFSARGAGGFPWRPRRLGDRNLLLIGDAAGYREPFSGEGMAQAMRSAECAVAAITQGGDIQAAYADLMRRLHAPALNRLQWIGSALRAELIHRLAGGPILLPEALLSRMVEWIHVRASA